MSKCGLQPCSFNVTSPIGQRLPSIAICWVQLGDMYTDCMGLHDLFTLALVFAIQIHANKDSSIRAIIMITVGSIYNWYLIVIV